MYIVNPYPNTIDDEGNYTVKDPLSWWTLYNIGLSTSLISVLIFYVPMLIIAPLSWINNKHIGFTFLLWAEFCTWFSITGFWVGPILMLIGITINDSDDLTPGSNVA